MNKFLFSLAISIVALSAQAQSKGVVCAVETPCAWQTDEESEGLGYCITQLTGDASQFSLHIADDRNQDLPPLELNTLRYTTAQVQAQSTDGKIKLDADLNQVGSLTINSKYGFFVFCEPK